MTTIDSKQVDTSLSSSPDPAQYPTNPSMIASGGDETSSPSSIIFNLSSSHVALIAIASFLTLLMLIFALYKYRNRDEGTYTIDETKNYGPFAELDMPLNGSKSKKKAKNRRKALAEKNKEWYV